MADDDGGYRIPFLRAAFVALVGNIPIALLRTELAALPLVVPITDARMMLMGEGVVVEWLGEPPTVADRAAVRNKVAAFVGGATSSAPLVSGNAGPVTAATGALVDLVDLQSPAVDKATYQVVVNAQMKMQAEVAGEAARLTMTITTTGAAPRVQRHHWPYAVDGAYNFTGTFEREAGQTIRVQVQGSEVGPGAGVAVFSDVRASIDKIG
jgi:hypothetical protein